MIRDKDVRRIRLFVVNSERGDCISKSRFDVFFLGGEGEGALARARQVLQRQQLARLMSSKKDSRRGC